MEKYPTYLEGKGSKGALCASGEPKSQEGQAGGGERHGTVGRKDLVTRLQAQPMKGQDPDPSYQCWARRRYLYPAGDGSPGPKGPAT